MKKTVLAFAAIMLYAACVPDTLEDLTTYPSEEDFQRFDTLAFFLNDLLWIPFGYTRGFKGWTKNKLQTHHSIASDGRRIRLSAAMSYRTQGQRTFDQYFSLRMDGLSAEPARIALDSASYRSIVLEDYRNDRIYETSPDEPVIVEIVVFDTLNRRIEGFFEGQLFETQAEVPGPPVEIRQGRFSMSF
jgi:hypothetical protein